MKETKDDNWSDWLINDKLRWERFTFFGRKERVSMWTGIVLGCLLFTAILVVAFLLIKKGNKLYDNTMLPFDSGEINYITIWFVLNVILSVIVFISKKSLRNDSNRIFNFFLLMVFNLLPSYFILGILFFTILYPNSSYGEKETINQRAIFTGKVRRVSRSNSVFCYSFYLPNMNRNVVISSGFDYDWKDKTACDIYLHKGYFGMYVVDSAVYKENQYYSTTLVAE
ncbi:hypothetical protein [Prevotella melaninogenica]|uniref:Uncharacterized protein n=1 Tax=Prevotella melaninogenica TaxID=28132 RepID=A0A7D4KGW0_9BACT|nr:hypothetical protein [Prevotella melaninogenica]EFC72473.1 hypothetical protein HMPREF0660_01857 [Prevotella melaninogenica D18]QKH89418.1 hypothetical protein FIU21_11005 [Prevotella melaninogenica]